MNNQGKGAKLAILTTVIILVLICIGFIIMTEKPPNAMKSSDSGIVSKESLSQAAKLLGAEFYNPPKALFYYSTKPNEVGGYEAYLKSVVSKEEFERLILELKLLPASKWPEGSPLESANKWFITQDINLPWWDPSLEDERNNIYGGYIGETGYCFVKYENNNMYYRASVSKWH